MKLSDVIKKKRAALENRHETSVKNVKQSMFSNESLLNKDKLPEGISTWWPKKGSHLIDIIPFIAGKSHPEQPEGEIVFNVDVWVHRNVGKMAKQFACPTKTYSQPCPICEYSKVNKVNWKEFAEKPSRRCYYLVWVHDSEEEEKKGVQVWEVPHFFFEQHVAAISRKPRTGGIIPYADPVVGKSICFDIVQDGSYTDASGEKAPAKKFVGFQFDDRPEPIPDDILDMTFPLDECMDLIKPYEEIEEAFYRRDANANETPDPEPDPTEDVQEERPARKPRFTRPTTVKEPEPEPDDGDGIGMCPFTSGPLGADHGTLSECDSCEIFDECADAASNLGVGTMEDPEPETVEKPTMRRPLIRKPQPVADEPEPDPEPEPAPASTPKRRLTLRRRTLK